MFSAAWPPHTHTAHHSDSFSRLMRWEFVGTSTHSHWHCTEHIVNGRNSIGWGPWHELQAAGRTDAFNGHNIALMSAIDNNKINGNIPRLLGGNYSWVALSIYGMWSRSPNTRMHRVHFSVGEFDSRWRSLYTRLLIMLCATQRDAREWEEKPRPLDFLQLHFANCNSIN